MDWIWYFILLVVMLAGLFINILGLPGLWLLVAAVAAYAWITGFDIYVGWPSLLTLLGLVIFAEIVEFVAGGAGAKAAGGTKRAMAGGIIGAVIGGVIMSPIFPIIGTILGACLGAFIGAAAVEVLIHGNARRATRVGTGAARGRFWGIIYKTGIGVVMFIVALVAAIPFGAPAPEIPTPVTPVLPPGTAPANPG